LIRAALVALEGNARRRFAIECASKPTKAPPGRKITRAIIRMGPSAPIMPKNDETPRVNIVLKVFIFGSFVL
jgi:hypothetical protein